MRSLFVLLCLPGLTAAQSPKASWAWVTQSQAALDKLQTQDKGARKTEPAKKASAILIIELPPGAQLFIQNEQMYGTGEVLRTFESPPLEPGKVYEYSVRIKNVIDGREGRAIVKVEAGKTSRVVFKEQTRLPSQQFQNFYPGRATVSGGC